MPEITKELVALIGALVGAGLTYLATRKTNATNLRIAKERLETDHRIAKEKLEAENRTTDRAIEAIRALLLEPKWKLRSFEAIRKNVRGFEDNELRKILVASGAVSFDQAGTGKELWGLRERNAEALVPGADQEPFRPEPMPAMPPPPSY